MAIEGPILVNEEPLRILHVEVENVLRLVQVDVDLPEGDVWLSGDNRQGKTSFVEAIEYAARGADAFAEVPLHAGAAKGRVFLILGWDGTPTWKVELILKRGSPARLVVTGADGLPKGRAQEFLDGLFDRIGFDPSEFLNPPGEKTAVGRGKKQREMLLRAFPVELDLVVHAAEVDRVFKGRAIVNGEVKRLEGEIGGLAVHGEIPADEDVSALQAQIRAGRAANEEKLAAGRNVEALGRDIETSQRLMQVRADKIDELKRELERQRGLLDGEQAQHVRLCQGREREREAFEAMPAVDLSDADTKIAAAVKTNAELAQRRSEKETRAKLLEKMRKGEKISDDATEKLKALAQQKVDALAKAKFPVPGLGFDDVGVTIAGPEGTRLPLDQASTAEATELALAVCAAMKRKVRTIFLRDGGDLGAAAIERIRDFAKRNRYQVVIERVAEDQPGAFVFQDGRVLTKEQLAARKAAQDADEDEGDERARIEAAEDE